MGWRKNLGKEGLDIIENYIWQHPDGNIEILLALYIEAIKKWLFVSSNPLILSEEIRRFLSPYTDKIFCNSSILKELAYELLFEAALIDHSAPSNIFDIGILICFLCYLLEQNLLNRYRGSCSVWSMQRTDQCCISEKPWEIISSIFRHIFQWYCDIWDSSGHYNWKRLSTSYWKHFPYINWFHSWKTFKWKAEGDIQKSEKYAKNRNNACQSLRKDLVSDYLFLAN